MYVIKSFMNDINLNLMDSTISKQIACVSRKTILYQRKKEKE